MEAETGYMSDSASTISGNSSAKSSDVLTLGDDFGRYGMPLTPKAGSSCADKSEFLEYSSSRSIEVITKPSHKSYSTSKPYAGPSRNPFKSKSYSTSAPYAGPTRNESSSKSSRNDFVHTIFKTKNLILLTDSSNSANWHEISKNKNKIIFRYILPFSRNLVSSHVKNDRYWNYKIVSST